MKRERQGENHPNPLLQPAEASDFRLRNDGRAPDKRQNEDPMAKSLPRRRIFDPEMTIGPR